jgi:Zn-finger nucleic acid-binding protein
MILACPACDSRYDLTGHPRGEAFRCRCGATMKLAAMPPADDEIACPRCGAAAPPTANTCAQCAAALVIKACPRCLSRVFQGHKHCSACGTELALAAANDIELGPAGAPGNDRRCPRCSAALHALRIDDIVIDECGGCRGVFLDHAAIKRITVDRSQARAEVLLGVLLRVELNPVPSAGQKMYLPCPVCHVVMNRRLFAAGTGVIIDVCRAHGTFFDAGELPQIIELMMNGSLDKQPRKPAPERADRLDRPRDPRHEISQPLPTSLPVARLHHDPARPRTTAGALVEFLASIFD